MNFKNYLKYLGLSISFFLFLALLLFFYLKSKSSLHLISESNFLNFDAKLYFEIKNNGYNQNWLCAFFPGFPYFWKLLNTSAIGISFLNSLLFVLSFSYISLIYKLNMSRHLFLLSIPSLLFMFVPYTESVFFVSGTVLIIGLNRNNTPLIAAALLMCSLIRPTTFVFIPAIIGTYLLTEKIFKDGLVKSIIPVMALISGLFITVCIHYSFSNKWFIFFEAQELWKNHLHFPEFPLTSWGGDGANRYDASALAISFFCGLYLLSLIQRKIKSSIVLSKDLVFSLFYITGTSILIIAYRDGNLYSLNRFIYSTLFFVIVLIHFFKEYIFKWKHVWIVFIGSEIIWLLFASYNHIHNLLLFSAVSLYFIFILFIKHPSKYLSNFSVFTLILINSIGFIKLVCRFLNSSWVG